MEQPQGRLACRTALHPSCAASRRSRQPRTLVWTYGPHAACCPELSAQWQRRPADRSRAAARILPPAVALGITHSSQPRLLDYRKDTLDLLCASGEVIWIGRKEGTEKEGKVAFFLAESKSLYAPYLQQLPDPESSKHPELLQRVKRLGASFITRLGREMDLPPSVMLEQLLELVWEGHVAGDQFAPLRLHGTKRATTLGKQGTGQGRWYWTGSLLDEEEENIEHDEDASSADLVPFVAAELAAVQRKDHMIPDALQGAGLQWVHHLLQSHGILTRELVNQASPFDWDSCCRSCGSWRNGEPSPAACSSETSKRCSSPPASSCPVIRSPLQLGSEELIVLSAVDPANPFGLITDWPFEQGVTYARKSGNYLVLKGEQWVAWVDNNGRRITLEPGVASGAEGSRARDKSARAAAAAHAVSRAGTGAGDSTAAGRSDARRAQPGRSATEAATPAGAGAEGSTAAGRPAVAPLKAGANQAPLLTPDDLTRLFRSLLQQGLKKVKVERWNGEPVEHSDGAELLLSLGAERDGKSLVLWPSQLR